MESEVTMPYEIAIANTFARTTFARQDEIIAEAHGTNDGEHIDINCNDIIDILMQNTGRFCERNLNDFMISWNSAMARMAETKCGDDYIVFAIRQLGVDSNLFFFSRVNDHKHIPGWSSVYYRKVFILRINRVLEDMIHGQMPDDIMVITATLKDVTNHIITTNMPKLRNDVTYFVDDDDVYYSALQNAYMFYELNKPFSPALIGAELYMDYYLTQHYDNPEKCGIEAMVIDMKNKRESEEDWRCTSQKDWADYCKKQIGLIAAIVKLRAEHGNC